MQELDGDAWRALTPQGTDAAAALAVAERQPTRRDGGRLLLGVTGGVAAGKTSFAEHVTAAAGGAAVAVGSDGFLLPNAELHARGLTARKGYPETYDRDALDAFLAAVHAGEPTAAPIYSHLLYDIVPGEHALVGDVSVVVVEGLHLGTPALGVKDRFDLVVHLDADDDDQERWFMERFRALRTLAAEDPAAYLYAPLRSMGAEVLDAFALDVWQAVNLPLLHEHVRPAAEHADVVLHLGPDHVVAWATLRRS